MRSLSLKDYEKEMLIGVLRYSKKQIDSLKPEKKEAHHLLYNSFIINLLIKLEKKS